MYRRRPRGGGGSSGPKLDAITASYAKALSGSTTGDDGATFKERTFALQPSTWSTTGSLPRPAPWALVISAPLPDGGPQPLRFYARRALNSAIHTLTVPILRRTPWSPFAEELWHDAISTGRDSFALWTAFTTAYADNPDAMRMLGVLRAVAVPAQEPLGRLVDTLVTTEFGGNICLDLRDAVNVANGDLMTVSNIRGLETLWISHTGVDDAVVRAWSRAPHHAQKLMKLRRLSLKGCTGVTFSAFEYTSWLPGLRVLEMTGCNLGNTWHTEARKWGWVYAPSMTLENEPEVGILTAKLKFMPYANEFLAGRFYGHMKADMGEARVFVRAKKTEAGGGEGGTKRKKPAVRQGPRKSKPPPEGFDFMKAIMG